MDQGFTVLASSSEWQNQICRGLTVDENFCGVETDTDSYSGSFGHQGVIIPPFNINIDEQPPTTQRELQPLAEQ